MLKKNNDSAKRLESWTKTLLNHLQNQYPQFRSVLNGQAKMPDGCPSKEALAEIVLKQISDDIIEIKGAFEDLLSGVHQK
ncbi:hypothetical protein BH10PLA1_BH10PLA1_09640 [soil metagenome]